MDTFLPETVRLSGLFFVSILYNLILFEYNVICILLCCINRYDARHLDDIDRAYGARRKRVSLPHNVVE